MALISNVLTAITVFFLSLCLFIQKAPEALQAFFNGFEYIKFLIQVFGVCLGFFYFYFNYSNQKKTQRVNVLQKKIDEGQKYLDELEAKYLLASQMVSEKMDANLVSSINLLGEKIFKFIYAHEEIFLISDEERKKLLYFYSLNSDTDLKRALEKNCIFSMITDHRVLLWSKLHT